MALMALAASATAQRALDSASDQTLHVRAVVDGAFDASQLWLRGEGAAPIAFARFPASGALALPGLPAGRYALELVWPGGSWSRDAHLVAGEDWIVELELDARREPVVELSAQRPREVPAGALVALHFLDARGAACQRLARVGIDDCARFPGCVAREAWIEVSTDGELLGCSPARFGEGSRPRARVALTNRALVLRLVDAQGAPLRGGRVTLATSDPDAPWSLQRVADARGRVQVRGLGFEEVVVDVRHPAAGARSNLLVPLGPRERTDLEVVVAGGQELTIRLLDGEEPLAGVEVALHGAVRPLFHGARHTDARGLARWGRVEPGAYQVHVGQRGLWPTWCELAFPGPGPPIAVQVPRRGGLALRLRDPRGEPIVGAQVALRWLPGGEAVADLVSDHGVRARPRDLRTDAAGALLLLGLPRGRYELELTTPAGERHRERLDLPGRATRRRTITLE